MTDTDDTIDHELLIIDEDTRFVFGYLVEALLLVLFGIGIGSMGASYSIVQTATSRPSVLALSLGGVFLVVTLSILLRHVRRLDVLQEIDG